MTNEIRQLKSHLLRIVSQSEEKMRGSASGSGTDMKVEDLPNFHYGLGAYDASKGALDQLYVLFPDLKE